MKNFRIFVFRMFTIDKYRIKLIRIVYYNQGRTEGGAWGATPPCFGKSAGIYYGTPPAFEILFKES